MIRVRAFLISCILLLSLTSFASPKVDSLETLLQNPNLSSADSLDLLNALGFELWTVNPARSVEVGRKALSLSFVQNNEVAAA